MSNFPILGWRPLDNAGAIMVAATATFYEAGSDTPYDTYSDEALAAPNTNPVVANGVGQFPEIYLDPDQEYKIVLKVAAGDTLATWDNINACQLASNSLVTRVRQIASNPIDYGAVGDGVANESSYIQEAIDAATGVVDLLGLTYKCDSQIVLRSGLILKNGSLDFSGCSDTDGYIKMSGTIGSGDVLSGNVSAGDYSIGVTSGSGFAAGDLCKLTDDGVWASTEKRGELVRVQSISGGTTFYIDGAVECGYTTANTANLYKITPVANVVLEDLRITCNTAEGQGYAIYAELCENISIRHCKVDGNGGAAVNIMQSADVEIDDLRVVESSAYGVLTTKENNDITIANSYFGKCANAVYAGLDNGVDGVSRNVKVYNCTFKGPTLSVTAGPFSQGVRAYQCKVIGEYNGTGGMRFFGVDSTADHCEFTETGIAIEWACAVTDTDAAPWHFEVTNSKFTRCTWAVKAAPGATFEAVKIDNNMLKDCTGTDQILLDCDAAADDLYQVSVSNNKILNPTGHGIVINVDTANAVVDRCQIVGNQIEQLAASKKGVDVNGTTTATNFMVAGNQIEGSGSQAIEIDTVTRLIVSENDIEGDASMVDAIDITSCVDVVVGNNRSSGNTAASSTGLKLTNCENVSLNGGVIKDADFGVYYTNATAARELLALSGVTVRDCDTAFYINSTTVNLTGVAVTGCVCTGVSGATEYCLHLKGAVLGTTINGNSFARDDDSDDNIHLDGGSAGSINGVAIDGNALTNGAYAVGTATDANATNVAFGAGNMALGWSTAICEGTTTITSAENGEGLQIKIATVELTGLTGATHNATNMIPDGALVLGFSTRITTSFGETNPVTGYEVGWGGDPNRVADVVGIAAGTTSNDSDAGSGTVLRTTGVITPIVTAVGGNFDGVGDIRLTCHYITNTAPTS